MKSARTYDKSELKLLEAGKSLFFRYGIDKTNVEDICAEAGVSKTTFYRKFEDKVDYTVHFLYKMQSDNMEVFESIKRAKSSFQEKVKEIVLLKTKYIKEISREFIEDVFKLDDGRVGIAMSEMSTSSNDALIELFKGAQKCGEVRKELNEKEIQYLVQKITEMMLDENFIDLYDCPQDAYTELIQFFFYGIAGNQDNKE